jgi:hypothetical protein
MVLACIPPEKALLSRQGAHNECSQDVCLPLLASIFRRVLPSNFSYVKIIVHLSGIGDTFAALSRRALLLRSYFKLQLGM